MSALIDCAPTGQERFVLLIVGYSKKMGGYQRGGEEGEGEWAAEVSLVVVEY